MAGPETSLSPSGPGAHPSKPPLLARPLSHPLPPALTKRASDQNAFRKPKLSPCAPCPLLLLPFPAPSPQSS